MTKRDVLSISLKVLGVVSLYRGVLFVILVSGSIASSFGRVKGGANSYVYLSSMIMAPILLLALAYILLRWGDAIARKLVREDGELPVIATSQWEKPVFVLALRVVGVVCLTLGIPRLLSAVGYAALTRGAPWISLSYGARDVLGSLILLAVGVYLLLGARHLVSFAFKKHKDAPTSIE